MARSSKSRIRAVLVMSWLLLLLYPLPINSKHNPQTPEAQIDYSMTAPLAKDGSNWPAKGYATQANFDALDPVATLVAGEDFEWTTEGTATHNGGSCQVGISYDMLKTVAVMASWVGGCPLAGKYTFKVPDIPGAKKALFWWSWHNKTGNREIYNNAAVVAVTGTAKSFTGPVPYRANSFPDGTCVNTEGVDQLFPNPGAQVVYGGDYEGKTPDGSAGKIAGCSQDVESDVTVTSDGSSAEAPADDGGSGGGATSTSNGGGGGGNATETGSGTAGAGGGASATGATGDATASSPAIKTTDSPTSKTTAASASGVGAGAGADADASTTSTSSPSSGSGTVSDEDDDSSSSTGDATLILGLSKTEFGLILAALLAAVLLFAILIIVRKRRARRESGEAGDEEEEEEAALSGGGHHHRRRRRRSSSAHKPRHSRRWNSSRKHEKRDTETETSESETGSSGSSSGSSEDEKSSSRRHRR